MARGNRKATVEELDTPLAPDANVGVQTDRSGTPTNHQLTEGEANRGALLASSQAAIAYYKDLEAKEAAEQEKQAKLAARAAASEA